MTNRTLLEYVWLDGYATPNLRSKIKVVKEWDGNAPRWNYDGSSTRQAEGDNSECILQPVRTYKWRDDHYMVLCEVLNPNYTPHHTNTRAALRPLRDHFSSEEFWWGFEQEYFITQNRSPLGFPAGGYPEPQGLYYCGVGGNQVQGRHLVESHLTKCLEMGIELTGVNAEVALGQWEYQCFAEDTLKSCDDLWMSRYLLYKMAESYGLDIDIGPKPLRGDWNGSGCHTNFSNRRMREEGDQGYYENILDSFAQRHSAHISEYGDGNENRLTGDHETQHIGEFSYGIADRGASIRIPNITVENEWKGYLEDRRPASNCDPYRVTRLIVEAVANIST